MVFSDAGTVQVVVRATGIPNGTPVRLRITSGTTVIDVPAQDLVDGRATFSASVPKGLGTLQATAQYAAP